TIEHALNNGLTQNIQERDWHSCYPFGIFRMSSYEEDCFYIHAAPFGAVARKIAEREGTHDGKRRKRESGSRARLRLCKSNDRRYWRIICGMVWRNAAEKFCSPISRCSSSSSIRFTTVSARLP